MSFTKVDFQFQREISTVRDGTSTTYEDSIEYHLIQTHLIVQPEEIQSIHILLNLIHEICKVHEVLALILLLILVLRQVTSNFS